MPDNAQLKVVATIEQQDYEFTQEQLGVNMDTPDDQVLDAVRGMLAEELQNGLRDQNGQYTFAVRRGVNRETGAETIYVYPKPGFGHGRTIKTFGLYPPDTHRINEGLSQRGCTDQDVISVTFDGTRYMVWYRE